MADAITVPTFEQIETVLSNLATNYSNMAAVFYDVFYNQTPMDVTFKMYDTAGELQTFTIPNRAKDKEYVLEGQGSPEGEVEGPKGSLYQDLLYGNLYIKETTSGNVGWQLFVTQEKIEEFFLNGNGVPEGSVEAVRGVLYIDKVNAGLYIKTTATGNTGWLLISASTGNLADRNLDNLTAMGEAHFANPSLSNLSTAGNAVLDSKENVTDRVTSISSSSTDTKYPTAKAVYTYVTAAVSDLVKNDFSNLTALNEAKVVWEAKQVGAGILKAPSGRAYVVSGNTVALKAGTIVSVSNGRIGSDMRLNNEIVEVASDVTGSIPSTASIRGRIFYDKSNSILRCPSDSQYFEGGIQPVGASVGSIWYSPYDNQHYRYSGTDWVTMKMAEVGRYSTNSSGGVASMTPFYPIRVATTQDVLDSKEGLAVKTGDNTFTGSNYFTGATSFTGPSVNITGAFSATSANSIFLASPYLLKQNNQIEGGELRFQRADQDPLMSGSIEPFIDLHNGAFRIVASNNNTTKVWTLCDMVNNASGTYSPVIQMGNGYVRYANGLTIQWGHSTLSGYARTISFTIPYSNTTYFVGGSVNNVNNNSYAIQVSKGSGSSCTFRGSGTDWSFNWYAIGF